MEAVVTDSTCDLHPDVARDLGLHVVPLHVLLGGRTFLDGQDIDPDAVYDHQRGGGEVSTAPAPQAAFEEVYPDLLATHGGVIGVHLSAHLSATADHARAAARALNAGSRLQVVDSGLASLPLAEAAPHRGPGGPPRRGRCRPFRRPCSPSSPCPPRRTCAAAGASRAPRPWLAPCLACGPRPALRGGPPPAGAAGACVPGGA